MKLRRAAMCLLVAGIAGLGGMASQAASVAVEIGVAPPPPRVVAVPPPRYGYVWVPGYWRWSGHRHVWVNGYWIRERHGWDGALQTRPILARKTGTSPAPSPAG